MSKENKTGYLKNQLVYDKQTFNEFIRESDITTKNDIIFSECTFNYPVTFSNIKAREFEFHKCKFNNEVFISDSSILIGGFTGCTFEKELALKNNTCHSYYVFRGNEAKEVRLNGEFKTLQLVQSTVKELTITDINSNHINRDSKIEFLADNNIEKIEIKPNTTYSKIFFYGGVYKSIYLEGVFNNQITFDKKTIAKTIYIESSAFKKRLNFYEGKYDYIYLNRSAFDGLIHINDFRDFSTSELKELSIKSLNLHSSTFDKDVTLTIEKIEDISLSNNNFKQHFVFYNYDDLSEVSDINQATRLGLDGINRGTIVIDKALLDVTFSGLNFGDIFIKNSKIWLFYIHDLDNKGSISLNNINHCSFFTIQDSVSGKLNFINTNINTFGEVIIADSNIEGANFHIYPNKIRSYSLNKKLGVGISEKSKNRSNLKNVYNQLKQISKKKGDIDISNKYQSLEYKQLLLSKRFGFDTFLLFLNLISNNNGRSWFRGILFTLVIAFLFFSIYIKIVGTSLNYENHFKEYVLFITSFPKLKLEKYIELNNTWQVSLIIWLSRIFIGYGIYQTISAFRKFGK